MPLGIDPTTNIMSYLSPTNKRRSKRYADSLPRQVVIPRKFKQPLQHRDYKMKEIRTEIDINASPEKAWEVLTDFDRFPQWNPFIRQISGSPEIGAKLKIQLQTSRGKSRTYRPTVTKVEPNHELRWFGKSIIPGIFNGERIFTIEPLKTNHVRFVHMEIFTGLGVALVGNRLDKDMNESFVKMNHAFKEKVEQASS
jgi:hypothetical protein